MLNSTGPIRGFHEPGRAALPPLSEPSPVEQLERALVWEDSTELGASPRLRPEVTSEGLLNALGRLAIYVGVSAVPGPVLGAVLHATQALAREPETHPEALHGFQDRLARWQMNAQIAFYGPDRPPLGELMEGPGLRVAGKHVLLPLGTGEPAGIAELLALRGADQNVKLLQALTAAGREELEAHLGDLAGLGDRFDGEPGVSGYALVEFCARLLEEFPDLKTEDFRKDNLHALVANFEGCREAVDVIARNYGSEAALESVMTVAEEGRCGLNTIFQPLEDEVLFHRWVPEQANIDRLAALTASETERVSNTRSDSVFPMAARLLGAICEIKPEAVDREGRQAILDGLLQRAEPGHAVRVITANPAIARLLASDESIVEQLLAASDHKVAHALLATAPLQGEAARRAAEILDRLPAGPGNQDVHTSILVSHYRENQLEQALAALPADQVAARSGVLKGDVSDLRTDQLVARSLIARFGPGELPELNRIVSSVFEAGALKGPLARAVDEDRLEDSVRGLETALQFFGEGKIGGYHHDAVSLYETAARLHPERPRQEAVGLAARRYRTVVETLSNGSRPPADRDALSVFALFADLPDARLEEDLVWLRDVVEQRGSGHGFKDTVSQIQATLEGLPTPEGLNLYRDVVATVGSDAFDLSLTLAEALKNSDARPEALERFKALASTTDDVAQAMEIFPAAEGFLAEGRSGGYDEVLDLVGAARALVKASPEDLPTVAIRVLDQVRAGTSPEEAPQKGALGALGFTPETSGLSIRREGDRVHVGGVSLNVRER